MSVIALDGELEIGRKAEIRQALRLGGDERSLLIDFSAVTYADSTALAELIRFHREAEAAGIPVAILLGNPQFSRLLQYSGLSNAFAVFDDRAAALASLEVRAGGAPVDEGSR
jgi:anti-anti-sigma factor